MENRIKWQNETTNWETRRKNEKTYERNRRRNEKTEDKMKKYKTETEDRMRKKKQNKEWGNRKNYDRTEDKKSRGTKIINFLNKSKKILFFIEIIWVLLCFVKEISSNY